MGRFMNGVFIGLGVGLLVTPRTGEEIRGLVAERVRYLRGIPPENEELKQSVQQMAQRVQSVQQAADRAAQMGNTVQNYAEQAAKNASSVQSDMSNLAQQAGTGSPQTSQGNVGTTKQNAPATRQIDEETTEPDLRRKPPKNR